MHRHRPWPARALAVVLLGAGLLVPFGCDALEEPVYSNPGDFQYEGDTPSVGPPAAIEAMRTEDGRVRLVWTDPLEERYARAYPTAFIVERLDPLARIDRDIDRFVWNEIGRTQETTFVDPARVFDADGVAYRVRTVHEADEGDRVSEPGAPLVVRTEPAAALAVPPQGIDGAACPDGTCQIVVTDEATAELSVDRYDAEGARVASRRLALPPPQGADPPFYQDTPFIPIHYAVANGGDLLAVAMCNTKFMRGGECVVALYDLARDTDQPMHALPYGAFDLARYPPLTHRHWPLLGFSARGRYVAVAHPGGHTVMVFDVATGDVAATFGSDTAVPPQPLPAGVDGDDVWFVAHRGVHLRVVAPESAPETWRMERRDRLRTLHGFESVTALTTRDGVHFAEEGPKGIQFSDLGTAVYDFERGTVLFEGRAEHSPRQPFLRMVTPTFAVYEEDFPNALFEYALVEIESDTARVRARARCAKGSARWASFSGGVLTVRCGGPSGDRLLAWSLDAPLSAEAAPPAPRTPQR